MISGQIFASSSPNTVGIVSPFRSVTTVMLRGVSSALPPTTTFVLSLTEYRHAEKITFLHSCNVADLSTLPRFAISLNTSAKPFVFMAIGSQRADVLTVRIKKIEHSICVSVLFAAAVAMRASQVFDVLAIPTFDQTPAPH